VPIFPRIILGKAVSPKVYQKGPLGISVCWCDFLQSRCTSCHPNESIKPL